MVMSEVEDVGDAVGDGDSVMSGEGKIESRKVDEGVSGLERSG